MLRLDGSIQHSITITTTSLYVMSSQGRFLGTSASVTSVLVQNDILFKCKVDHTYFGYQCSVCKEKYLTPYKYHMCDIDPVIILGTWFTLYIAYTKT